MKGFKYNIKHILFGHVILFVIFLSALPEGDTSGLERIVATYVLSLMLTYSVTMNWKKSIVAALLFTLLLGFLDSAGPFNDYIHMFDRYNRSPSTYQYINDIGHRVGDQVVGKYTEHFDLKPAGEGAEDSGNSYAESKTEDTDNTNFNDEDLDKILETDEKQSTDENEHLKKAGGGLDQLKDLIDMAKKESPYSGEPKGTGDYTPAQAQRATFHLIDTVKQLKETMSEMMPLMKAGKNLIGLHKKMGGEDLTKALKA